VDIFLIMTMIMTASFHTEVEIRCIVSRRRQRWSPTCLLPIPSASDNGPTGSPVAQTSCTTENRAVGSATLLLSRIWIQFYQQEQLSASDSEQKSRLPEDETGDLLPGTVNNASGTAWFLYA